MLRALQRAASGAGQGANMCDKCATDVGSLSCTCIHRRTAPAGPARPCEAVCAPAMRRCSAFSSVRRRRPVGGSGQGHAATWEHCAHLLVPVGVAGYRVALPAEVAGVREVGGRGPGVKAAEPEIVPTLAKGAPELEQAGADAAPVVLTEGFLSDRLPCVFGEYPAVVEGRNQVIAHRAGVPLWGRHIGVTPAEPGHKSVPQASFNGAPSGEVQQGVVRNHLRPHLQLVAAVQLPAQRGGKFGGEHEEQGSWNVAQPAQAVIVCRPQFFEMCHSKPGAPVLRREPPDNGCVASPCVYLCGSEYVGGVRDEAGGEGCPEERGHIASPPRIGFWGRLQPFHGGRVPRALRAHPNNQRGPQPGVWPPPSSGTAAYCGGGVPGARVVGNHWSKLRAHSAPTMCASHAVMEMRPMIHGGKSVPRRCFEKPPGRSR